MRRKTAAAATAFVIAALLPATALAKFPPFSVEVRPERATAGEPITVVLRTWEDTAHTMVADWDLPSPMDGLLGLYRAEDLGEGVGRVDVRLTETASGVWSVALPPLEPGTWVLRTFPDRARGDVMPPGYPELTMFTVAVALAEDEIGPFVMPSSGRVAPKMMI